jgi:hypothetical protein
MDPIFNKYIKIGIEFPKKLVKLPKNWTNITKNLNMCENPVNYAILTGKINNIIVVDIDKKNNQLPGLEWFTKCFGQLKALDTLVIESINGGYHIYFQYTSSIKNKNNYLSKHIDILVDKKCVYEGKGYNILHNFPPRELTSDEIKYLIETPLPPLTLSPKSNTLSEELKMLDFPIVKSGQKIIINDVRKLQKINPHIPIHLSTEWSVENNEGTLKCIPINYNTCLVNTHKQHTQQDHSAIFINTNGSVVKSCYSCGTKPIPLDVAKKLDKQFKLILQMEKKEDTVYCRLKDDVLLNVKGFARDRNGNVYECVKSYAYLFYKTAADFLVEYFKDDSEYQSLPNNLENLLKFMKSCDDSRFPFIKPDKRYIGYFNGVFDTQTAAFTTTPQSDVICKKYFDTEFTGSTDTPLFDKIINYQFDPATRDFIYMCLGRMFGIRDNYGFMLYLLGEAGCGKSLVIDVLSECFTDVGCISDSFEAKYGLSYLYDKDIIVCDDIPKHISKIFPQQTFQTIVTGGKISTAVKNGMALNITWTTPLLFAGNWFPDYLDKGQISRRLLIANFEKNVYNPDPSLKSRIINEELPALILKCCTMYNDFVLLHAKNKSIWEIAPDYFIQQQTELKIDRNPLFKFLLENSRYEKDNIVFIEDVRSKFSNWLGTSVKSLDNGTFGQVNKEYIIETRKVCKHCKKVSHKDCCEKYKHIDRSKRKIVLNIVLL